MKKMSVTIEKRFRGSEGSDEGASIGPGCGDVDVDYNFVCWDDLRRVRKLIAKDVFKQRTSKLKEHSTVFFRYI